MSETSHTHKLKKKKKSKVFKNLSSAWGRVRKGNEERMANLVRNKKTKNEGGGQKGKNISNIIR